MAKRKTRKSKPAAKAAPEHSLAGLENQICDLDRAARIAFLMMMHDAENADDLGMFAVEEVERLASELRASFYLARGEGKAVRT